MPTAIFSVLQQERQGRAVKHTHSAAQGASQAAAQREESQFSATPEIWNQIKTNYMDWFRN